MRLVTRRLPKAVKTNRETRFLVKVGDDFYRTRHCPTDWRGPPATTRLGFALVKCRSPF